MKFHYETVLHAPGESFSIEIQSGAILDCVYHVHPEFELTFVESGFGTRFVGDLIEPFREHDLWGVSYCVPQSVIRLFMPDFTLRAGLHMRANFYKCGDDLCPPHELCWSPITNGVTDFHQPAFFGDLYLQ